MAEQTMMDKIKASAAVKALRGALPSGDKAGTAPSTVQTLSGGNRDKFNQAVEAGETNARSYADWLKEQKRI